MEIILYEPDVWFSTPRVCGGNVHARIVDVDNRTHFVLEDIAAAFCPMCKPEDLMKCVENVPVEARKSIRLVCSDGVVGFKEVIGYKDFVLWANEHISEMQRVEFLWNADRGMSAYYRNLVADAELVEPLERYMRSICAE
jgi:hypothetical protein